MPRKRSKPADEKAEPPSDTGVFPCGCTIHWPTSAINAAGCREGHADWRPPDEDG